MEEIRCHNSNAKSSQKIKRRRYVNCHDYRTFKKRKKKAAILKNFLKSVFPKIY